MSNQNRQPAGQPIGGQFAATARAESSVTLAAPAARPYADHTPADIDTLLAEVHKKYAAAVAELETATRRHDRGVEMLARRQAGDLRAPAYMTDAVVEGYARRVEEAQAAVDEHAREMEPFDAEYEARGGWTRAFIVRNANGHVHSSMSCPTCHPTTSFAWLPEYSGRDEADIVGDAGESACTVCYPSAPAAVLARPSKIEDPERRAARLERERVTAERQAKKQATGISTPDGAELRREPTTDGYRGEVVKTERAAEMIAVAAAADIIRGGRPLTVAGDPFPDNAPEWSHRSWRDMKSMVEALAHKRDQSVDEVLAVIERKAIAKNKRG